MSKEEAELMAGDRREESPEKKAWQQPKLAFVEPKLTKHAELEKVTSGFFCVFFP